MYVAILLLCGPFETHVSVPRSLSSHVFHPIKGQIEWIAEAILPGIRNVPRNISLEIRLFVTGIRSYGDAEFRSMTEGSNKSVLRVLNSPLVRVQPGRPDLHGLVKDKIARAAGDVSINGIVPPIQSCWSSLTQASVCGANAMANAVRSAARAPRPLDILKGGPDVSLHIESFDLVSSNQLSLRIVDTDHHCLVICLRNFCHSLKEIYPIASVVPTLYIDPIQKFVFHVDASHQGSRTETGECYKHRDDRTCSEAVRQ